MQCPKAAPLLPVRLGLSLVLWGVVWALALVLFFLWVVALPGVAPTAGRGAPRLPWLRTLDSDSLMAPLLTLRGSLDALCVPLTARVPFCAGVLRMLVGVTYLGGRLDGAGVGVAWMPALGLMSPLSAEVAAALSSPFMSTDTARPALRLPSPLEDSSCDKEGPL